MSIVADSPVARLSPSGRVITGLRIALCLVVACVGASLVLYRPLAALPAVLGAIVSAGILVQPFIGVPVIFLLGMSGDLQRFGMGLSIVKFVIVLILVGFMASLALRRVTLRKTGLELPLVVFILVYCAGLSRDLGNAEDLSGFFTVLGYPLGFFLVLNLVRTHRNLKWIAAAVAVGALVASLASAFERYAGYSPLLALRGIQPMFEPTIVARGWQRTAGLMQDPNATAYPHLLAIPLLIGVTLATRKRTLKTALLAVTGVSVFGLAITFSRSAYLGLLGGLLCLVFLLRSWKSFGALAIASALVFVILGVVPEEALTARFENAPEVFWQDRWIQYQTGLSLTLEHPLFGAGKEAFVLQMRNKVGQPLEPHSNLLAVAINSGLAGLGTFLWLGVRYARFVHRGFASMVGSSLRYYAIGSYSGLLGFLVQGLFIGNMGWFLLWAMAAIPPCCLLLHKDARPVRAQTLAARSVSYGH